MRPVAAALSCVGLAVRLGEKPAGAAVRLRAPGGVAGLFRARVESGVGFSGVMLCVSGLWPGGDGERFMRKAVVTIVCGELHRRMARITHPTLRAYAEKLGADWIVWDDHAGHAMPHYKKLDLGKLLDVYDRVLYLDNDILIREDAPDIFALVPQDALGVLEESRYVDRTLEVVPFMVSLNFNPANWDRRYYNTGVMVLSKPHKNLFAQPLVERDHYGEQTFLNLMIAHTKTKTYSLPHRFNRMLVMDSDHGEDRADSYFLHYAGVHRYLDEAAQLNMIAGDLARWEQCKGDYRFRKRIAFHVEGDLADQIVAEPVIRYARDVVYPGDNIVIVSDWPEAFGHLGLPVYPTLDPVPDHEKFHIRRTLHNFFPHKPDQDLVRHRVHGVNLAAFHALKMELPLDSKTPRLEVEPNAMRAVVDRLGSIDVAKLVAVHAGRGWKSNTLPVEAWQSYVDILAQNGCWVALIGGKQTRGFDAVDLDASRCLNLVDRLSFAEIVALLSKAPVLLSNDSASVQVAGGIRHVDRADCHVAAARIRATFQKQISVLESQESRAIGNVR